ncbi:MAG: DUF3800 domain-containing protein [Anaerolineales bacterium]|nr:DUF3800 domain-containing protein [Chloroflexota bacterium]MBL6980939.1 DUF3800 domain-containing protein [Anaerolineales bacterium]
MLQKYKDLDGKTMHDNYHFSFIDESGTTSPFSGSRFFVVALLDTKNPRKVEMHVRRLHKRFGTNLKSGEMKANASQENTIRKFLSTIANESIEIIVIIVDKKSIWRPPKNNEKIYREAVSLAVSHAIRLWQKVEIYLDKRYTSRRLRKTLEKEIREKISDFPHQVVIIHQENSIARKELQAADFISWAFFQKYERGDSQFYEIISGNVIVEEVIRRRLW